MLNEGEETRSPKTKVIRVESEENTGLCERRKEYGAGRGEKEDLRTRAR